MKSIWTLLNSIATGICLAFISDLFEATKIESIIITAVSSSSIAIILTILAERKK